jgi:hypothetical protein
LVAGPPGRLKLLAALNLSERRAGRMRISSGIRQPIFFYFGFWIEGRGFEAMHFNPGPLIQNPKSKIQN